MNSWYAARELAREHEADLEREAAKNRLASSLLEHEHTGGHRYSRARLVTAILGIVRRDYIVRRDHSLTDYPCRLPDGSIGRVAAVLRQEEWTLVCRAAPRGWSAPA